MELHKKTCEQFALLPVFLWHLQSKLVSSTSGTRRAKRCRDVTVPPEKRTRSRRADGAGAAVRLLRPAAGSQLFVAEPVFLFGFD